MPLRAYLAVRDDTERERVDAMLRAFGHQVDLSTQDGSVLIAKTLQTQPDVILVSEQLSDMAGITALLTISEHQARPSILLAQPTSDFDNLELAMQDHVMSYLIQPVSENDLRPAIPLAIKRFEYIHSLEKQVADLRDRLEQRKMIERAKGILMKSHAIDEGAAHRRLQQLARKKRQKLVDTARDIAEPSA